MIGFMFIVALVFYLSISTGVVWLVVLWARGSGRGVKRWAAAAILVMYLLVFWDHVPTLVLYKYYCNTKSGFWVYKTPEQWMAENPGVAETLTWRGNSKSFNNSDGSWGDTLNERFVWVHKKKSTFFPVRLHEETIVDTNNGEVVARRSYSGAGYSKGIMEFKFWVKLKPCTGESSEFYKLVDKFQKIGGE